MTSVSILTFTTTLKSTVTDHSTITVTTTLTENQTDTVTTSRKTKRLPVIEISTVMNSKIEETESGEALLENLKPKQVNTMAVTTVPMF